MGFNSAFKGLTLALSVILGTVQSVTDPALDARGSISSKSLPYHLVSSPTRPSAQPYLIVQLVDAN